MANLRRRKFMASMEGNEHLKTIIGPIIGVSKLIYVFPIFLKIPLSFFGIFRVPTPSF